MPTKLYTIWASTNSNWLTNNTCVCTDLQPTHTRTLTAVHVLRMQTAQSLSSHSSNSHATTTGAANSAACLAKDSNSQTNEEVPGQGLMPCSVIHVA